MLKDLSQKELGRLRMSVGYGRQKKGRPHSPIEVGLLLRRARNAGASLKECADAIRLDGTGHIGRFLQILDLPNDLQHLVDWGVSNKTIGFSAAVELSRLEDEDDQRSVARSILADGLRTREVQQVRQLCTRSNRSIGGCIQEILRMRPTVETRYVFLGSIEDPSVVTILAGLTQNARNSILKSGLASVGLQKANGRLGTRFFTLIGDKEFNDSMMRLGKQNLEAQIRTHICDALENGRAYC